MLAMDATDEYSVQSCIRQVIEVASRLDVVINAVNEMILGSVLETSIVIDRIRQAEIGV